MMDVFIRRGKFGYRHTEREESHAKAEAEIGVIYLQAKECQRVLASTRARWSEAGFFPEPSEGMWACRHLDFGVWASGM